MTDLVSIFSSIILLATISTLAVALFAYTAYKVRERRKPESEASKGSTKDGAFHPIFLRRFLPGEADPPEADPPEDGGQSRRHGDEPATRKGADE